MCYLICIFSKHLLRVKTYNIFFLGGIVKRRIIDNFAVKGNRKETDETWDHYANSLIAAFSEKMFSEKFIEQAYTTQRIRNFDEKFLDSIIYNVPPAFLSVKHLFRRTPDNEAYTYIKKMVMDWRGSEDSPLFLLGYVGTGKTTFLHYAFGLKNKLRTDCKVSSSIVNFKKAPSTPDKMLLFIVKSINNSINEEFPEIAKFNKEILYKLFEMELEGLENTITNKEELNKRIDSFLGQFPLCIAQGDFDKIELLVKKKIEYLKKYKDVTQYWLILDNIDQHYYCLHQRVLINTLSLAGALKCQLIISMRYITLNTSEAREVYSSYFPRKLNLSLPDVTSLIKKRINVFNEIVSEFKEIHLAMTGNQYTISDLCNDIEKVLTLLANSDVVTKFLLPLSNYNIRRLLQIILNSMQSYYFFFDYFNNDRYLPNKNILYKRIIFSHCLKNQDHFDPQSDDEEVFIINLYENENQATIYNQTIRIRMLQALQSFGKHIEISEYTGILTNTFNYEMIDILRCMRLFLKAQLFAVKGVVDEDFNERIFLDSLKEEDMYSKDITICLTYAGMCHADLMYNLEYLEIMKFSTYVYPDIYFDIQHENSQKPFKLRLKGIRKFISYLNNEENIELEKVVKNRKHFYQYFGKFGDILKNRVEEQIDEVVALQ